MKICPNCGTKNSDSARQCNFCDTHFPETEAKTKKEAEYVHDHETEKKKAKTSKLIIALVAILVIAALAGILAVVFSDDKTSKSEELAGMLIDAFTENGSFTGTLKGKNADISFSGSITSDGVTVLFTGGKYDSLFISKNGMVLETDRETEKNTTEVTSDMEAYKLYVAYLTLLNVKNSVKNILKYDTNNIKSSLIPVIKEHLVENFDDKFIEDNFISGIASALMTFENDNHLSSLCGIKLSGDVGNSEISFNVASYDLQNHMLSQFKKAYKNSADYDEINQLLKDSKSHVKNSYGASGTIKTENGKLKSSSTNLMYNGYSYTLNLSFGA
jgi:hypothetical protein